MNKIKTYYCILFIVLSIVFAGSDNVDEVTKVGTAAANWLKLETGTRAIGMGGAFTSIGGGVIGIPYNPASVAFIKNQEGFLAAVFFARRKRPKMLRKRRNGFGAAGDFRQNRGKQCGILLLSRLVLA